MGRIWISGLILCWIMSPTWAQADEEEKPSPPSSSQDFRVYWREGLRMESADGSFQVRFGMRLELDWAFQSADRQLESAAGSFLNGTEIRRGRLGVSGVLHRQVEFKIEYDFAGGEASAKDVYLELPGLPMGSLRVGHFKEPFSLEELTSSKHITFLERALPNLFAPSRNMGLMLQNTAVQERLNWAVGAFRDADDSAFGLARNGYAATGRLTGLPLYAGDGRELVHLGVSYTHRKPEDDRLRLRQRPEAHLAPRLVDTGTFEARALDQVALEGAFVYGPFSLQSEYLHSTVDRGGRPDAEVSGGYLYGSFFLTGEHRNYKTSDAAFDRVSPRRNFVTRSGGPGAWEVAVRYSRLELNDIWLPGGRLDDLTLALNWYLNPYTRIMWNYVRAERQAVGGADIFQVRFNVNF